MSYNISLANKLPSDCSIIQCEIYAITRACEFVENMDFVGKRINICTDSQMAINALSSHILKTSTVLECTRKLNQISATNTVTITWVPGHWGVTGNEVADILAKQGSNLHLSYTVDIPIPISVARSKLREVGELQWKRKWNNMSTSIISKTLWPELNIKFSKSLISFERNTLGRIVQTLTWHMTVGKHALRMGIASHPTCLGCETPASEVDSLHYWCSYSTLSIVRFMYLESYFFPSIDYLRNISMSNKINFILNSYWFLG